MKEARFYNLADIASINDIGASEYALNNFKHKKNEHIIFIKNLSAVSANILKQEAIAVDASVLNNENTIISVREKFDCILLIKDYQIDILINRLNKQAFNLKRLAMYLKNIKSIKTYPKIMAIMNVNNNSFYEKSKVSNEDFIKKAYEFIEDGAEILDIGMASSNPKVNYIGKDAEYNELKKLINIINKTTLAKDVSLSIDSFDEDCIKLALDNGFKIVNDISANTKLSYLAKQYNATYILMHSKNDYIKNYLYGTGRSDNHFENRFDVLDEVYNFFENNLKDVQSNVIIDIGIGFGKSQYENFVLIKYLEHFKSLNQPILLAASNKACFKEYFNAASLYAHALTCADYIRVHDVKEQNALIKYIKKMDEI